MTATPQDPIARLVREALQLDADINSVERVPTGDDYNTLLALIRGLAEPLPINAPKREHGTPTFYECDNCDWNGTMSEINGIHHIHHIHDRVLPGELAPAGACPECGAVIPVDDADVPHYTLYNVGAIMRQRGWTVAPPPDCPALLPGPKADVIKFLLGEAVRDAITAYDKQIDLPWGTLRRAFVAYDRQTKGA